MAETFAEIPDRDQFKTSEVCEIAKIQSYVLRSWEQEFPNLGAVRSEGGPRIYQRGDVERVLRIKQLVFGEGLTLAGARRRLEGTEPAVEPAAALEAVPEDIPAAWDNEARARLLTMRRDLRSLLEMLDKRPDPVGGMTKEAVPRQPALPEMERGVDEVGTTGWLYRSPSNPGKRKVPGVRGRSGASE